ncbi:hypothetical protein [Lacrimispora sp.]|uniref:hypothetical protein n=1 Tax=Lacrimispora sp. TaxID=2719234 RepID=UPI00289C8FB5|nr:hypothetical protein [Lacrimispora sp.]
MNQKVHLEKECERIQNDRQELFSQKAGCYEKYADDQISKEKFPEQKMNFKKQISELDSYMEKIKNK